MYLPIFRDLVNLDCLCLSVAFVSFFFWLISNERQNIRYIPLTLLVFLSFKQYSACQFFFHTACQKNTQYNRQKKSNRSLSLSLWWRRKGAEKKVNIYDKSHHRSCVKKFISATIRDRSLMFLCPCPLYSRMNRVQQ